MFISISLCKTRREPPRPWKEGEGWEEVRKENEEVNREDEREAEADGDAHLHRPGE
jgi:hypothetical protein